jgi:TatA/E family protein of Tat protein translocase
MIGTSEIILIVLAILLLFGGKKLPELARNLGKGIAILKKEMREAKDSMEREIQDNSERKG